MKHIPQDWSVLHSVWDWDPLNVFTPIHRSRTDTPIHRYTDCRSFRDKAWLVWGLLFLLNFRFCLGSISGRCLGLFWLGLG